MQFDDHLFDFLRDHIPLKQGLRLINKLCHQKPGLLRDHIPLKQGLRLISFFLSVTTSPTLRDHIPLKQGLRLYIRVANNTSNDLTQRPYSIKTRIKTICL